MNFLEAIAREEGFYAHGSRPNRNCNPGDIEYGPFAKAHGATDTDGRFAIFPTDFVGFAAMKALFTEHYAGMTIAQAIAKWAPSNENDVAAYVKNVCQWTGLDAMTVIDSHLG